MSLSLLEQPQTLQAQAEAFSRTTQYRLWELGQLALSSREQLLVRALQLPSQLMELVEV
jgi:hypothetical protein